VNGAALLGVVVHELGLVDDERALAPAHADGTTCNVREKWVRGREKCGDCLGVILAANGRREGPHGPAEAMLSVKYDSRMTTAQSGRTRQERHGTARVARHVMQYVEGRVLPWTHSCTLSHEWINFIRELWKRWFHADGEGDGHGWQQLLSAMLPTVAGDGAAVGADGRAGAAADDNAARGHAVLEARSGRVEGTAGKHVDGTAGASCRLAVLHANAVECKARAARHIEGTRLLVAVEDRVLGVLEEAPGTGGQWR